MVYPAVCALCWQVAGLMTPRSSGDIRGNVWGAGKQEHARGRVLGLVARGKATYSVEFRDKMPNCLWTKSRDQLLHNPRTWSRTSSHKILQTARQGERLLWRHECYCDCQKLPTPLRWMNDWPPTAQRAALSYPRQPTQALLCAAARMYQPLRSFTGHGRLMSCSSTIDLDSTRAVVRKVGTNGSNRAVRIGGSKTRVHCFCGACTPHSDGFVPRRRTCQTVLWVTAKHCALRGRRWISILGTKQLQQAPLD